MSAMPDDGSLSDDEIIRQFGRVVFHTREIVDPDTLDRRKRQAEINLERERKESEKQAIQWKEAEERQKRQEDFKLSQMTNGRHKGLGRNQTIFVDTTCEYCCAEIKTPIKGWSGFASKMNGFIEGTMWDKSFIDEDKNHSKPHECIDNIEVLNKKISGLRRELEDYKTWAYDYFRHMAKM